MAYEFFYWPEIRGRGEFVRLALEDAGAAYIDVARGQESEGLGVPAMLALMRGEGTSHIPFAPPFLRDGEMIVSHTATILLYLGGRIGLAPTDEDGRLWTHQIQLTITDIVKRALAADGSLSIDVLSAKPDWVELLVPCSLEIADRLQGFMMRLDADLPEEVRESVGYAFR